MTFFERFCADQHLGCEVVSDIEGLQVRRGEVYIAIRQIDVVSIIKKSRVEGLQCGVDFGLIGYNDTPAYEVIDQGITALKCGLGKRWEIKLLSLFCRGKPYKITCLRRSG